MPGWLADPNRGAIDRDQTRALRYARSAEVEILAAREFFGGDAAQVSWLRFETPPAAAGDTAVAGSAQAQAVPQAAIITRIAALGAALGVSIGNAQLSGSIALAGGPSAQAGTSGAVGTAIAAAGSVAVVAAPSGALTVQAAFAGNALAQTIIAAAVSTLIAAIGAAAAQGSAAAGLGTQIAVAGGAQAQAAPTGTLGSGAAQLAGSSAAQAGAGGTLIGWGSVTLAWTTVANAVGYRIKIGTAPGVYDRTVDTGNVLIHAVGGLMPGVTYYWTVVALHVSGDEGLEATAGSGTPDLPGGPVSVSAAAIAAAVATAAMTTQILPAGTVQALSTVAASLQSAAALLAGNAAANATPGASLGTVDAVAGQAGAQTTVQGALAGAAAALQGFAAAQAQVNAQGQIAASGLPQPAKDRLVARFAEAKDVFTAGEVKAAIDGERAYLAKFVESGKPVIQFDDVRVEDRKVKVADMLSAFFDPAHKEHRNVQSFRECYIEITGDRRVTGLIDNCDMTRLTESLGVFREAISSATFANVLGASLRRQMVAEYNAAVEYDTWQRIATTSPIADFRTNERTRFGGYGDLPAVAENAAYTAATSPSDEKATYAISKRGYTEVISIETIANDDVGAIRRIPMKMGRAAKRTLAKFVFDFARRARRIRPHRISPSTPRHSP